MKNPIFKVEEGSDYYGEMEPGWYFCDEIWASFYGPFDSLERAWRELDDYCIAMGITGTRCWDGKKAIVVPKKRTNI